MHLTHMLIYKIFTNDQWLALQADGTTLGAPIDLADGYIHFSSAMQAAETAEKHFAGQTDLWLLGVDQDDLSDVRWEKSRGGQLFPHFYGALSLNNVSWALPLPLGDDGHVFPEDPS